MLLNNIKFTYINGEKKVYARIYSQDLGIEKFAYKMLRNAKMSATVLTVLR